MLLKLGQIAGVLLMAAGIAAHVMRADAMLMPTLIVLGLIIFVACRLVSWLAGKGP